MELTSTGYGPRQAQGRYARLCFDGDERHYEQWEVKFLVYMRLQKLKDTTPCLKKSSHCTLVHIFAKY